MYNRELLYMKAVIIHGFEGHADEHWLPRLKGKLEALGLDTVVPSFPNASEPKLDAWLKFFKQTCRELDEDTILIGHSLGVPFMLQMLRRTRSKICAAFHVSGCASDLPHLSADIRRRIDGAFYSTDPEKDLSTVKSLCGHHTYHGTDDEIVPKDKAEELAAILGTKVHWIEGGGHLNVNTSGEKIDELLQHIVVDVQKLLQEPSRLPGD